MALLTARTRLALVGGLALASALTACSGARARMETASSSADARVQTAIAEAELAAEHAHVATVVQTAELAVADTLAVLAAPEWPRERFLIALAADDADAIHALAPTVTAAPTDARAEEATIRYLMWRGEWASARDRAVVAYTTYPEARPTWTRLRYDAFAGDAVLFPPPTRFVVDQDGDEFIDFAQASSVLFRVKLDDETVAVFKPQQSVQHTNYRGEVAAYRLCEIIGCDFVIPHNREVFVREDDFLALTELEHFDETRRFYRAHSHLEWYTDDTGTRWLYGTLKDWIPGFCRFPLEYLEFWQPLTRPRDDYAERWQRRRLADVIEPLLLLPSGHHAEIMERADDMTAFDLGHELSDMHAFDLLINNHDRELPDEHRYGMNLLFDDGHLVSIDNGASFRTHAVRDAAESYRHLRRVRVFSRSLIDEVRHMDTEALFPLLFPDSAYHDDDAERYADFLVRRQMLLDYVDDLIDQYGEAQVLVFP